MAKIANILSHPTEIENKFMFIKERISHLLEYKGIAKENFYKKIGMTSANFRGNAKETPLNSTAIENILSEIPDLNLTWLITGKGTMLQEPFVSQNIIGSKNFQANNVGEQTVNKKKDRAIIKHLQLQINELNTLLKEKDTFIKMLLEQQAVLIEKLK